MGYKEKEPAAGLKSNLSRGLQITGVISVILVLSLMLIGCTSTSTVTISGVAVSGVTTDSATIAWNTSGNSTGLVEFGLTNSYGLQTTPTTTESMTHSVKMTDLKDGKTYYYRVRSGDAVSAGGTFTTNAIPPVGIIPVIYGVAVSNVKDVSATIAWNTSSVGNDQVVYGLTTSYGSQTTLSTTTSLVHSVSLTGLTANTTYHYQVKSSGAVSADGTFKTVASLAAITALWTSSDHNNVAFGTDPNYGPTALTNTYCARCHSPFNWDPNALRGGPVPGSCFNCKLAGTMRTNSLGSQPVNPAKFTPIGCTTCHPNSGTAEIALWNNGTKTYDKVATSGELCLSCHDDGWGGYMAATSPSTKAGDSGKVTAGSTATTLIDATNNFLTTVAVGMSVYNITDDSQATVVTVVSDSTITTTALVSRGGGIVVSDLTWAVGDSYQIYQGPLMPGAVFDGTGRGIRTGGSAHPNNIGTLAAEKAPRYCDDCHDPHSGDTSCKDCHKNLTTSGPTTAKNSHIAAMDKVTCVACHGKDPVLTALGWLTSTGADNVVTNIKFTVGSNSTATPPKFTAGNTHFINRTAKTCVACHYTANPWGLAVKS